MKSFSNVLSRREIDDVADFVFETFVRCAEHNTLYHTAENGWPDHGERYGPALPFATGTLPVDIAPERLDETGRRGLALFRSTCISCHEGRLSRSEPVSITVAAEGQSRDEHSGEAGHKDETAHHDAYDTPTIHDIPPNIAGLTAAEQRGRDLYTRACADCHAADGSGKNWVGSFLRPRPPDFTTSAFAAAFDAARFAEATLRAPEGTTMPSFAAVFSAADAADIAAYVQRAFVQGTER